MFQGPLHTSGALRFNPLAVLGTTNPWRIPGPALVTTWSAIVQSVQSATRQSLAFGHSLTAHLPPPNSALWLHPHHRPARHGVPPRRLNLNPPCQQSPKFHLTNTKRASSSQLRLITLYQPPCIPKLLCAPPYPTSEPILPSG